MVGTRLAWFLLGGKPYVSACGATTYARLPPTPTQVLGIQGLTKALIRLIYSCCINYNSDKNPCCKCGQQSGN